MPGRLSAIAFLLAALALPFGAVHAQRGTRPEVAQGYNAAERRAVEARVEQLQRINAAQATTIARIAKVVELEYPGLSASDLIKRIEERVELAVDLDSRILVLEGEVAGLRAAARGEAQGLLADARAAFELADFDKAEAAFGRLTELIEARSGEDAALLIEAVRARALSAELRGSEADYARARGYRLDALQRQRAERERLRVEEWELSLEQVEADLRLARVVGIPGALAQAQALAEGPMLALVSRSDDPVRWGRTQGKIGEIATVRAMFATGEEERAFFNRAFDAFAAALDAINLESQPGEYASVQRQAAVLMTLLASKRSRESALELLEASISYSAGARNFFMKAGLNDEAAKATSDAAVTMIVFANNQTDTNRRAEALRGAIEVGTEALGLFTENAKVEDRATVHHNICVAWLNLASMDVAVGRRGEEQRSALNSARTHCDTAIALQDVDVFPIPHGMSRFARARVSILQAGFPEVDSRSILLSAREDVAIVLAITEKTSDDPWGGNIIAIMGTVRELDALLDGAQP